MRGELQQHQESQQARDGVISELKALVERWMGQVKGKGNGSDPTPQASGAGSRNTSPPPRQRAAGTPGEVGNLADKGEGSGRRPERAGKKAWT